MRGRVTSPSTHKQQIRNYHPKMINFIKPQAEPILTTALATAFSMGTFTSTLAVGQSVSVPYDIVVACDFEPSDLEVPLSFQESMAQIHRGELIDLDDVLTEPDEE